MFDEPLKSRVTFLEYLSIWIDNRKRNYEIAFYVKMKSSYNTYTSIAFKRF